MTRAHNRCQDARVGPEQHWNTVLRGLGVSRYRGEAEASAGTMHQKANTTSFMESSMHAMNQDSASGNLSLAARGSLTFKTPSITNSFCLSSGVDISYVQLSFNSREL